MKCFWVSTGKPMEVLNADQQKEFDEATTLFVGCILSVLGDRLVEVYIHMTDAKELWDALIAKFGATDASNNLYIMELFHDYKMADNRSVVEQAHVIQTMAKKLEQAHEYSVEGLIASLDVEEKTREKDSASKGDGGQSSANVVHKAQNKSKGKYKAQQTTNLKKKKNNNPNQDERTCFVCGLPGHLARKCPQRKGMKALAGQTSKSANVTIGNTRDGSGYDNLPSGFSVNQSTNWWIDIGANVARGSTVLIGNGSHASVHGVGTVDLKFTSGKIVQLKNVQHIPTIDRNLVSGSRLTRDGFKLVFESNKIVLSKHGYFIGKCYECGGLFRFSLSDFLQVPNRNKDKTPYEIWIGRKPSLSYLRTWGCLAKVNVPITKKRKLGPKTVDCVFLGYAHHSIAYRFLIVKSEVPDMHVGTIMESRDATFFVNFFLMKDTHSSSSQPSEIIPSSITSPEQTEHTHEHVTEENDSEGPRRSNRQRTAKSFGDDFIVYLVDDTSKSISKAYASPDADYWKEAVRSEMDSIITNGTWEVIERPYGCKPVGCKWVFKKKLRPDGTIEKYKARLVAKCYTQKEELDEEIYMDQPDEFVVDGQEGKKQAPKQWHEKFDKTLTSAGFAINEKILNRIGYIDKLTALDTATVEAEWVRDLLMHLPIVEKSVPAILMNCDNQTKAGKSLHEGTITKCDRQCIEGDGFETHSILERTYLCELDCWSQSMKMLGESSRKLTKD
uniref:OSJNBb0069N01.13 protein n=1 Tax=Oryza sativa subsp. japonica TaxID=39947 RepID=Q7XRG0_ORYSJ|nr:OSJNBb0069N01.13 [Oryza sativa Japonica Group]